PRLPHRGARCQPPAARARPLALRRRALPARLSRPPDRLVHRPVPPAPAPPLRRARPTARARRNRDPRLPHGREGDGPRDRPAAAAHARRSPRRRRDAVLLARPDQRDDHEPPRGTRSGARAVGAPRRRDPLLRVVYFGTYERDYPRNAQVISCLRGAGVEVLERHAPVWEGRRESWSAGAGTAARLAAAEMRLARPLPPCDAVVVGYPGHADMPLARVLARSRPLVFNPLVSLSDTLVGDRGRFRAGSVAARALAAVDRVALRAADLVVADTEANADLLARLGDLPRSEIEVCFVGAEERVFRPGWYPDDPFTCLFVGKLIPLHGLETILEAARIAPELPFRLVGSG